MLSIWLCFLLPVAIHYTRKAHREADASGGRYVWSHGVLHRPVLMWFLFYCATLLSIVVIATLAGP